MAADPALGALDDPDVLALAGERRILVTRDSRDFAPLLREWAEADRHHAGCILIWSPRHREFSEAIGGIARPLSAHPGAADWPDLTVTI